MSLASLTEVLKPAYEQGFAVPGFVVLGLEDARAYVKAAEQENAAVILQTGPNCRRHTPLPILATMLRHLAQQVSVPVVVHLDHAFSIDECKQAIKLGYTSVMYDGSSLPFEQNLANTAQIVELARQAGVSVEAELGVVGYDQGQSSQATDPAEARKFAQQTGIDALAISIGNLHLQTARSSKIDCDILQRIQAGTDLPLVIHGGSGIATPQRRRLALNSQVCKFNIGTELRMVFGSSLRETLASLPDSFDRIELLSATEKPLKQAAAQIIRSFLPS